MNGSISNWINWGEWHGDERAAGRWRRRDPQVGDPGGLPPPSLGHEVKQKSRAAGEWQQDCARRARLSGTGARGAQGTIWGHEGLLSIAARPVKQHESQGIPQQQPWLNKWQHGQSGRSLQAEREGPV